MAYESLRAEIRKLADVAPQAIVLHLENGAEFSYEGDALSFALAAMQRGPVANACARTLAATGCGALWLLGAAFAAGPVRLQKGRYVSRSTRRRKRKVLRGAGESKS